MIFFFSPVRIYNRREQSCDCSLLRDILRLNERGLLCRRGFAIWLRGAGKNGPLCVHPGRGAGRASRAEPGARRRERSGRHGRGRTVGVRGSRGRGSHVVPRDGRRQGLLPADRRTEVARKDAPTGGRRRTDGSRAPDPRARAGRSGGRHCGGSSPFVKPTRQWAARRGTCSAERPINRLRVQLPSRPSPRTGEPSTALPGGGGSRPPAAPSRAAGHRRRAPPGREPAPASHRRVLGAGWLSPWGPAPSHTVRPAGHPRTQRCSLRLASEPDS